MARESPSGRSAPDADDEDLLRVGVNRHRDVAHQTMQGDRARVFTRLGLPVVLVAVLLAAPFAALVFLGDFYVALIGMILWGIGFATQDTLLKAIIAGLLPQGKRNLAFGLYYAGYGCGWLVGSVTTGLLYDRSIPALVAFSVGVQLASLPLFVIADRKNRAAASQ